MLPMETYSRELLSNLENELHTIGMEYDKPIVMSKKAIEKTALALKELKDFTLKYKFKNEDEEILFFKTIKPRFTSKIIYFNNIHKLESRIPLGSNEIIREFWDKQLAKLQSKFQDNSDFYYYFRSEHIFMDKIIFVRGNANIQYNLHSFYYEMDERFSTTHDFKVAGIIANDLIIMYINQRIEDLSLKKVPALIPTHYKTLHWTLAKTSLIELVYALHTVKAFDEGSVELNEIAKYFEEIFDVQLGDIYRAGNEIKNRKINSTKFLDSLKASLLKKFQDQDVK